MSSSQFTNEGFIDGEGRSKVFIEADINICHGQKPTEKFTHLKKAILGRNYDL